MAQLIGNPNIVGNHKTTTQGSGSHNPGPTVHTNTRATSRKSYRSLLSQFTNNQATTTEEVVEPNRLFNKYFREYEALAENTRAAMTFQKYNNIIYKKTPMGQPKSDLICKVTKLSLPSFDGSSKCLAKAWVQKLDTYFKLNPMFEADVTQFATLHLEGEVSD